MELFIVSYSVCDSTWILGVFDTYESALSFKKLAKESYGCYDTFFDCINIDKRELNKIPSQEDFFDYTHG